MTVNNNLHHNGTIRADWWNYYEGIYFITLTVKNRIHAFDEITRNLETGRNQMHLSQLGKFVDDEIPKIMDHYPYTFVPSWVVMPDHVRFIIMIDVRGKTWNDGVSNQCRRVSRHAPTIPDAPNQCGRVSRHAPTINSEYMASITPKRGSLGLVIGRFKGAVTQYANANHIPFKWQPRFYDSIIFDQNDFERVWHYIENNVNNWETSEIN